MITVNREFLNDLKKEIKTKFPKMNPELISSTIDYLFDCRVLFNRSGEFYSRAYYIMDIIWADKRNSTSTRRWKCYNTWALKKCYLSKTDTYEDITAKEKTDIDKIIDFLKTRECIKTKAEDIIDEMYYNELQLLFNVMDEMYDNGNYEAIMYFLNPNLFKNDKDFSLKGVWHQITELMGDQKWDEIIRLLNYKFFDNYGRYRPD